MGNRVLLQEILENLLGSGNVYFQPPSNVDLEYPCIIYERSNSETIFADNKPYMYQLAYKITVIDQDPDSEILDKVASLPMCVFDRHYIAGNLNHDVYIIYY